MLSRRFNPIVPLKWRIVRIETTEENGLSEVWFVEQKQPIPLQQIDRVENWQSFGEGIEGLKPAFADVLWLQGKGIGNLLNKLDLNKIMNAGGKVLVPETFKKDSAFFRHLGFARAKEQEIKLDGQKYLVFKKENIPCCGS